ncbi:DNA-binding protein [Acetobacter persici]|uniref:Helix-turn-helix domain-containing protein n=1 Tax=Acetobacter persici TaxID=1076596 RepID=A0A6V8IAD2_9PROT|nr:DNA-binding protein [Acetobacter persici]OUI93572.1 hypothetical protein HK19_06805 [Acetobacter persici]GFE94052.1 hypothetical protein DmAi_21110 [Acetobacter persici]
MPSTAQSQNDRIQMMGSIAHFPAHHQKGGSTPLVVSEAEAAALVNLAPRTLQAKRLDGTGPAYVQLTKRRIGYAMEALRVWVAAQSCKSTAEASVKARGAA